MSADDERDPSAETPQLEQQAQLGQQEEPGQQPDPELLRAFDAFRARRAEERAQAEPFPDEYGQQEAESEQGYMPSPLPTESIAPGYVEAPGYDYAQLPPPEYSHVHATTPAWRWRSVAIFGSVVVLVVGGLGAGIHVALQPSGHPLNVPSPVATASASASLGTDAATGDGQAVKALTVRLTVTAVDADSFTATARGKTVVVHLTSETRFGTAARPFARSQLVEGAVVFARLRRESDGTVVATVIAS